MTHTTRGIIFASIILAILGLYFVRACNQVQSAKTTDSTHRLFDLAEDQGILDATLVTYNERATTAWWQEFANTCQVYREMFEEAEAATGIPASLLAGIGLHESMGCSMDRTGGDGERGIMQLHIPDARRHLLPAAEALEITPDSIKFKTSAKHNIFVGAFMLRDYVDRLDGSLLHGIQAYNAGVGGVRRYARNEGWKAGISLPTISALQPRMTNTHRDYTVRVLASTAIMHRLNEKRPLHHVDELSMTDLP